MKIPLFKKNLVVMKISLFTKKAVYKNTSIGDFPAPQHWTKWRCYIKGLPARFAERAILTIQPHFFDWRIISHRLPAVQLSSAHFIIARNGSTGPQGLGIAPGTRRNFSSLTQNFVDEDNRLWNSSFWKDVITWKKNILSTKIILWSKLFLSTTAKPFQK